MAKQRSLSHRIFIERSLHNNYTFTSIAWQLNRSPSTNAREVNRCRIFVDRLPTNGENDCIQFQSCTRNSMTNLLGINLFMKLFPVILTDKGVEFKDPEHLKYTNNGCQRMRIFYSDTQASWQKS